ncbi:MAG: putative sugar nucleotidyl transferase [Balneolales bacterium]
MIFFEDEGHRHFYPLTITRPMDDLRLGILKVHEKWLHYLQETTFSRKLRPLLEPVFENPVSADGGDDLWINGRFVPDEGVALPIRELHPGQGLMHGNVPVAVRLSGQAGSAWTGQGPDFSGVSFKPLNAGFLLTRIWELFQRNGLEIEKDFALLNRAVPSRQTNTEHSIVVNPEKVHFGEEVQVHAGVVIDASQGGIHIGSGVTVMSGSVIRGPAAIGNGSIVKMGAKIYPETTIGPVCKVGGEIKCVIIQGYSNKAHEGFLGNSLIGEWCNIGADSNTSNLKNNYKLVYLKNWETGEPYDVGIDHCGTIMADHGKTGINSMLSTGTMCGVACNLFTNKFTPRLIPSFTWISDDGTVVHRFDKAMETARIMMGRRKILLSDEYYNMMQSIFDNR